MTLPRFACLVLSTWSSISSNAAPKSGELCAWSSAIRSGDAPILRAVSTMLNMSCCCLIMDSVWFRLMACMYSISSFFCFTCFSSFAKAFSVFLLASLSSRLSLIYFCSCVLRLVEFMSLWVALNCCVEFLSDFRVDTCSFKRPLSLRSFVTSLRRYSIISRDLSISSRSFSLSASVIDDRVVSTTTCFSTTTSVAALAASLSISSWCASACCAIWSCSILS
mmetsp:Transcript_17098/g.35738  ORF Transcript_17098/g.35738 Transcript_17098/m.35738 type:complete len:222 (-) Transcript_17098:143-808(-)